MFQSKFVKTTNLRISYNVTVINNFLYSFCLSKWYLSIFFGKASIICNQYILWVSLRWNSIFKSFQGFIFPLSLNNWPINFNFFFFQKKRKMHRRTVNLNIWVKPKNLRQDQGWKSWFWSKVIYQFYENMKEWKFWKNVIAHINIFMKLEILT